MSPGHPQTPVNGEPHAGAEFGSSMWHRQRATHVTHAGAERRPVLCAVAARYAHPHAGADCQQQALHQKVKSRGPRFRAALLPPKSNTPSKRKPPYFAEYEIRARRVPQWPLKPVICKAVGFLPRHAVLPSKMLDLHCHRSTIPLNPIKLIGFAM